MRIVVDCAHGAAYEIAPHVFHELGAEVIPIGASPDGFNINEKVGATHPDAVRKAVKAHRADLGIALDGDADRVMMIDADGRLYNGDELLYVVVRDGVEQGRRSGVVGTLMTNLAVEQAVRALGVDFARAKVGDRYVLEMMVDADGSGAARVRATCCASTSTPPATASSARCRSCRRCVAPARRLSELTAAVRLLPQTMINVKIGKGFDWEGYGPLTEARALGRGRPRRAGPHPDPAVRHRAAVAGDGRGAVGNGREPGGATPRREPRRRVVARHAGARGRVARSRRRAVTPRRPARPKVTTGADQHGRMAPPSTDRRGPNVTPAQAGAQSANPPPCHDTVIALTYRGANSAFRHSKDPP